MQENKKQAMIEKLVEIVGTNDVRADASTLCAYSADASVHSSRPDVVVRPRTVEHVQEIMRYANAEKIPVIPRGSGSSTSGHTTAIAGGIMLDFKQMNKIIEIRPEDILCRVQPGVIDDDLNKELKPFGFFWPAAPASSRIATIGGEIGANASGVRSVKYGATRDSVLGLKVVLANGDLVHLGSNTRVASSGYQIERLMVGSEGTLAIIVEATLKIVPIPKYRCIGVANFNSLGDAGQAVSDIMSSGASPSMLELMDYIGIKTVNKVLNVGLPDVPAILLYEADGMTTEAVDYEMNSISRICRENGASGIKESYDAEERSKIYLGRKKLFASLSRYKEGIVCTDLADDMAVPNSKMAETTLKIHEIAKNNNVIMSVYGHCGSGVVHTKIMFEVTMKEGWENAKNAADELYSFMASVGGTTSGEHGIGLSKAPYLMKEKKDSIVLMRALKKAFDPNNILNPYKLMDAPKNWVEATKLRYNVKA